MEGERQVLYDGCALVGVSTVANDHFAILTGTCPACVEALLLDLAVGMRSVDSCVSYFFSCGLLSALLMRTCAGKSETRDFRLRSDMSGFLSGDF